MSEDKIQKGADIVVLSVIRDSACVERGEELWKGRYLRMEGDRPLCLGCADLDHFVFLPSGPHGTGCQVLDLARRGRPIQPSAEALRGAGNFGGGLSA